MRIKDLNCEDCVAKAAWIGMWTSLILALMEYYIGWIGDSAGVVASAINSMICMLSSISILLTRSIVMKKADQRFPYGYGKIEFVVSGVVSVSILVVIMLFFIANIRALVQEVHPVPHIMTAAIAIISIIANEFLFRFFKCVGSQMSSHSILATAWAVRSDAFISVAVLCGVVGSNLGIKHLDPVVAIGITLILFKTVGENLLHSIGGLMDYSSDEGPRLERLLKKVPEIIAIKSIRTRSMGQLIKVDLELQVSSALTVEEIDKLENLISGQILKQEKKIGDISISFSGGVDE